MFLVARFRLQVSQPIIPSLENLGMARFVLMTKPCYDTLDAF